MTTTQTIRLVAGETEPITGYAYLTSAASLSTSDLSTLVLYVRKALATTNHVDGADISSGATVASVLQSDGTYLVTITWTFDPVDAKNGGGNAFDAAGSYQCYPKITWTDGDVTKHRADDADIEYITVKVLDGFE